MLAGVEKDVEFAVSDRSQWRDMLPYTIGVLQHFAKMMNDDDCNFTYVFIFKEFLLSPWLQLSL